MVDNFVHKPLRCGINVQCSDGLPLCLRLIKLIFRSDKFTRCRIQLAQSISQTFQRPLNILASLTRTSSTTSKWPLLRERLQSSALHNSASFKTRLHVISPISTVKMSVEQAIMDSSA
nr:hypothetical protein CFP56_34966 [Quercus suber]